MPLGFENDFDLDLGFAGLVRRTTDIGRDTEEKKKTT